MSTPARIHVLLARRGASAVVFRRGPSDKVAVLGWDREKDEFYCLRCQYRGNEADVLAKNELARFRYGAMYERFTFEE